MPPWVALPARSARCGALVGRAGPARRIAAAGCRMLFTAASLAPHPTRCAVPPLPPLLRRGPDARAHCRENQSECVAAQGRPPFALPCPAVHAPAAARGTLDQVGWVVPLYNARVSRRRRWGGASLGRAGQLGGRVESRWHAEQKRLSTDPCGSNPPTGPLTPNPAPQF